MSNTVFQIRRNTISGTRPTTSSIQPGELALNLPDGILFSTNGSTVFEVGANNTNINVTGNATINAIVASGSLGTLNQVLTSNSIGGIFWASPGAASVNTAAQYTWSNTQTFTNTITFSSQLQVGANVIANTTTIFVGNSSVNTNITADTILLNGVNVNTAITGNAATAYANAVANAAALYQTTAGLSANVAVLSANSATYLGNSAGTIANVASWITGNAATAYSNAVTYIGAQSFVNTSQLSSNLLNYALLSGGLFTGSVNATSYTVGTTFIANATNILVGGTGTSNGVNANTTTIFIGNSSVSATINATSFSGTASNATNLNSQPGSYYTNATNITTGTLPYAQLGSNVVNTSANFTITGMYTYSNGITFSNTITANASNGTAGQVLTSSGSTGNVYWSTISGVNTAAQYTFSNTITFSGNLTSSGWVNLKTYVETASAPTISGSALTLDLSNSSVFNVNLNSSITILTISNAPSTGNAVSGFVLIFTATGTAYTVVWPSSTPNVRWANGVAPTITSTNNKRDVYVFFTTDNGSTYNAFISGQNI